MSTPDRRAMLDRADKARSIRRQCMLLGIARSGVYRPPRPANDNDLALMRRVDELFTAWPFLGSRRMTAMLKTEGLQDNRKRVQRLMRKMGIAALGPKPNTTKPAPGHKIYPYLLRNMTIDRPNQVWAADITYLPTGRGFLYLVEGLCRRSRGQGRNRKLDRLLQRSSPSSGTRLSRADGGLARTDAGFEGCGHDGQR
ncbi:IS3 family transposase [Bradyrhizobium cajani]|uniref:IS3 family transposase n=1 Tax=Bradyrhizobium cajani TaxID=1928661 RepID=A0A844TDY5_9BRAD|nr:IS3 family transposase [Bradyrhizobium cajani]MCP3367606.1 IS3 family transposase [Bradyrhizobium cajani]MVT73662.1 IS3 family transposase [Bradyrhizobium cajani]